MNSREVLRPSGRNSYLWGSSNEWSSRITGESARILGVSGYRPSDSPAAADLARDFLRRIRRSRPTRSSLFSGHADVPGLVKGARVTLPLTACSPSSDTARQYAEGDSPVLLRFAPGTLAMVYTDEESITAGTFTVVSVKRGVDPFWKTPLKSVVLSGGAGQFR